MNEATSEIAGGALSFTGTIIGGILQYLSQRSANKTNLEIYRQSRIDELARQRREEKLRKKEIALAGRAQAFTEEESEKNRAERTEERGYGRMQGAYQRATDLLSKNYQLLQTKTAPFVKRG